MSNTRIFETLAFTSCSHQFSWPRRASEGEYYQVCVLCGDQYDYDWNSMRRLGRKPLQPLRQNASTQRAVAWNPRARRIPLSGPVRYREPGTDTWMEGGLKNISTSGVLFSCSCSLQSGTPLQLELEMPHEICGGSTQRLVVCDALVTRTDANICAAQILDYTFIGQGS